MAYVLFWQFTLAWLCIQWIFKEKFNTFCRWKLCVLDVRFYGHMSALVHKWLRVFLLLLILEFWYVGLTVRYVNTDLWLVEILYAVVCLWRPWKHQGWRCGLVSLLLLSVLELSVASSKTDPPDVLDRQKCLDALAELRRSKWFQVWLLTLSFAHSSVSSIDRTLWTWFLKHTLEKFEVTVENVTDCILFVCRIIRITVIYQYVDRCLRLNGDVLNIHYVTLPLPLVRFDKI